MGVVQAAQADYLLVNCHSAIVSPALTQNISQIHSLRHPFNPVTLSGIISTMILTALPTYIIDIALLFRVIAVYPPDAVSRWRFALVVALPILMKILRVIEWIIWSMEAVHRVSTTTGPAYVESSLQHGCAIARLTMTVVDNRFASLTPFEPDLNHPCTVISPLYSCGSSAQVFHSPRNPVWWRSQLEVSVGI